VHADGAIFPVLELVRRLFLNVIRTDSKLRVGGTGLDLPGLNLGRIGNGRIVRHRKVDQTPAALSGKRGSRSAFHDYDSFHQRGFGFEYVEPEGATSRVRHDDGRANLSDHL